MMKDSEIRQIVDELVPDETTTEMRPNCVKFAVCKLADMILTDTITFAQYCSGVQYLFERNRSLEDAESHASVAQK